MKRLLWVTVIVSMSLTGFAQEGRKGSPGFVDNKGKIYKANKYRGVIPGIRDVPAVPSKEHPPKAKNPIIEWVGFQPFKDHSRVFIQIIGPYTFSVTKKGTNLIEVAIPKAKIATPNDARELITDKFATMVKKITIKKKEDMVGPYVAVDIFLKQDVGYLFHQEGKYIFIDVETNL